MYVNLNALERTNIYIFSISEKFTLTKTLRPFAAPVSCALAGKNGGKGKLVTLITGITNARPPLEVSPHHLPIRDTGRCPTHNGCERT